MPDKKEIDKIMEKEGVDRETAWKIYQNKRDLDLTPEQIRMFQLELGDQTELFLAEECGLDFPLDKKYKIRFRREGNRFIYCLVDENNRETLQTETSLNFYRNERKRHEFYKNIKKAYIKATGEESKKRMEQIDHLLEEILLKIQKNSALTTAYKVGKQSTWETRETKETKGKQQEYSIHGSGGIYQDLVIEPIGGYRYVYNYKGKKGVSSVDYDPETGVSSIEIEGENFFFSSPPLKECIFRVPSEESIRKYVNGEYPLKDAPELFRELVNYFKIFFDLPQSFYYEIVAIACLQSWVVDILYTVFYLCFSASHGSGKTAFLEALSIVVRHGFLAGNISSASVARIIDKYKLTLLCDELDTISQNRDNEVYQIFRLGYKKGNLYVRQKETGKGGYTEEVIDPFSFKAYTIHSKVEPALATRSIEVPLRMSDDTRLPVINIAKEQYGFPLFEDLFFYYLEHGSSLPGCFSCFQPPKNARNKGGQQEKNLSPIVSFVSRVAGGPIERGVHIKNSVRDELFNGLVESFTGEEIEILRNFFGRNEELFFVCLQICKMFKISRLDALQHVFKSKIQLEGDDNVFIGLLRDLLREIYFNNKHDTKFILADGEYEDCFCYEKTKAYREFRQRLMDEGFSPIGPAKFDEYLMTLGFSRGVNIRKERFQVEGKQTSRLALIFDDEVRRKLEVDMEIKKSPKEFREEFGRELNQDFFNEYYQNRYGESEEELYKELVTFGLLDYLTEDELRRYIRRAVEYDIERWGDR